MRRAATSTLYAASGGAPTEHVGDREDEPRTLRLQGAAAASRGGPSLASEQGVDVFLERRRQQVLRVVAAERREAAASLEDRRVEHLPAGDLRHHYSDLLPVGLHRPCDRAVLHMQRSAERRVGTEWGGTCSSRW